MYHVGRASPNPYRLLDKIYSLSLSPLAWYTLSHGRNLNRIIIASRAPSATVYLLSLITNSRKPITSYQTPRKPHQTLRKSNLNTPKPTEPRPTPAAAFFFSFVFFRMRSGTRLDPILTPFFFLRRDLIRNGTDRCR